MKPKFSTLVVNLYLLFNQGITNVYPVIMSSSLTILESGGIPAVLQLLTAQTLLSLIKGQGHASGIRSALGLPRNEAFRQVCAVMSIITF